ncbi:MAG: MFS transporter [Chloroflexota bacterium]|nr:MFS transporter [Chloroflexota bacterium]
MGRPPERHSGLGTFASLRNLDYRYLWIGNLFNTAGQWIQQITVGWLVWELSHSPLLVGLVGGLRALPFLFMGPLGGVLADRVDRRRMLMTTQTLLAAVAVAFAVVVALGWVQVWHALVFTFITGCGFAVNQPVRQSLIANTVPRKDLGNAIALSAMAANSTRMIGPAVGGVLIVAFGPAGNFLIQAGLFLCMVAIIFPMKVRYRDAVTSGSASAMRNLKDGFTYVWGNRTLFGLMMLSFVPALFVTPFIQMLPVFTEEVFHSKANVYGYLVSAFGVGGLLATLTLASFSSSIRSGLLGIVALVASSIIVILFALSSHLPLSLLLLVALGASQMTFRVNNNTLVQTMAPDELRGRVMSIYHLEHGFMPLASFILGLSAELFSAPSAVAVSGMLSLAVIAALMLGIKRMRDVSNLRA